MAKTLRQKLEKSVLEKGTFDKEGQAFIDSLVKVDIENGQLESMKRTAGWKVLENKLREELCSRILKLVEDDKVVQTLISLLTVTNTKQARKTLEDAIAEALPE